MIKIISSNEALGAKITGLDLSKTLSNENEKIIMHALGQYGQICFPNQKLKTGELKSFSKCFGTLEINIAASSFCDKDHPEVMILSNIIQDGKPLELFDARQDWHTDMYYSKDIAFANVLYGLKIPRREGISLGCTKFADMLNFLFKHQLQKKFIYEHKWSENDVIMWDNIGTLHNAVADYTSLEHRFIKRCQVMADKVLEMPLTM